ncbi:MAG TPA: glycosyl transferase family 2 [Terriglobia bacterium]|nr:glycosyl transferase family 2 [Terriglobia bacterium]
MAEETFISDDFLRQLTAVGGADILIGIPTANNRETVGHVVNAVQIGLVKYFPRERAVLINPDAGSKDSTPEAVRSAAVQDFHSFLATAPLRTTHIVTERYHPNRGPGGALHLILAAADLLRVKACVLISPNITSITPEWVDALVRPVYREGYDFLAPVYERHKFDGLLVRNILSPLISAVYGRRIDEPAGGEFGLSGALACQLLAQDVWHQDFIRQGPAVWMTAAALAGNYRLGQSFLGPKIQIAGNSDQNLPDTIQNTVGALFRSFELTEASWISRDGSEAVPMFGFQSELDLGPVRINRKKLSEMFRTGVTELSSILEQILAAPTLKEIQQSAQDGTGGRFADELWVKTIYEFAISYHRSVMNRDHLLQALTPIYRGRISSFVLENHGASAGELRARREALLEQYDRLKPYFVQGWSAKA